MGCRTRQAQPAKALQARVKMKCQFNDLNLKKNQKVQECSHRSKSRPTARRGFSGVIVQRNALSGARRDWHGWKMI
jgi:hypothetical protein